jgi:hypothetical protein
MDENAPKQELQTLTSADRIRQLNEVDKVRRPSQLKRNIIVNIHALGCH